MEKFLWDLKLKNGILIEYFVLLIHWIENKKDRIPFNTMIREEF